MDAVGPFGPEDIKTGNSRPEFPKLDVSTALFAISSTRLKAGEEETKTIHQKSSTPLQSTAKAGHLFLHR